MREYVQKIMRDCGLREDMMHRYPHQFSGGQRQRISIARCLLRETPVLVADEATAALDAKTAYDVVDAILDMDELTRIIVTHQLEEALLSRYDEIIVMKNGHIEECGSFTELLDKKGYFYLLYNVAA